MIIGSFDKVEMCPYADELSLVEVVIIVIWHGPDVEVGTMPNFPQFWHAFVQLWNQEWK